jgi:hypothetical protein
MCRRRIENGATNAFPKAKLPFSAFHRPPSPLPHAAHFPVAALWELRSANFALLALFNSQRVIKSRFIA